MARIPLSEVPNAPALAGPPASVKYPGAPSVQLSNQPYSNYRAATLPNIANFEKYGDELKQGPLPAGFAQGAEMAESALGTQASALGSYAYIAGKATKELGDAVSTGMLAIGSIITKSANQANESKDAVDMIRYTESEAAQTDAFQAKMMKEGVPESQWADKWQEEGAKFLENASRYATTPLTKAKIMARAQGFVDGQTAKWTLNVQQKSRKDDAEKLAGTIDRGLEPGGDRNLGEQANNIAFSLKYINEARRDENAHKFDRARNGDIWQSAVSLSPKKARDEAALVLEGKKSEDFPFMNGDKEMATNAYNAATGEWNRRRGQAQTEIQNDILDGGNQIDAEEIRARGRAAELDEKDIDALVKSAQKDIPFDNTATANAVKAVANYQNEARGDTDMSRRNAIFNQIITTTSPETQKLLTEELNGYWKNRNDPGTPQQKEVQEAYSVIDKYRDGGLLVGKDKEGKPIKLPSGFGTKPGEKEKIVDEKAFQAAEARRMDLYFEVQAYVKDNPSFKAGELIKHINGLAAPDAQQKADDAPGSQMPTPPRATFYRAEPKIPAAMQWRYGENTTMGPAPAPVFPTTGAPSQEEIDARLKEREKAKGAPTTSSTTSGLSDALVLNVKEFEGFNPNAYSDYKQTSIGYGTRAMSSDQKVTKEQADLMLRSELAMHAERVDQAARMTGMRLTPGQRDALISFDFNTGKGAYLIQSSAGNASQIAQRMSQYTKAGGKTNEGLVNRRQKEIAMFNT